MNKKMKKIFGAMLTAMFFVAPVVTFGATLNGDPRDFATLRVFNYTDAPTCTTCWGSLAAADTSDIVNLAIYYHNTGSDDAKNVRVKLTPQSTNSGTAHTFYATVSADNAPTVTGTAVVTTSSNQVVSFMTNGVIWRPNQKVNGSSPLPFGQSANDIFSSSGLNLGNVADGWATQGSVIVRLQVSSSGVSVNNNSVPFVSTNSASSVSQNAATLNGYVTSNGSNTNAWFEWGPTSSLGNTTPSLSFGTTASSLNSALFNLNSNTTYYYRAVAQNGAGTVNGSIFSFTTAPVVNNTVNNQIFVSTNSANFVSQNSATLNGYVSPNGSNTNAWFEWGTNTNFGNTTPLQNYGTNASSLSSTIFNLNPNTTYYYRAVAQGLSGNIYGGTNSFTTNGATQTNNVVTGNAPTATTLLATETTDTAAKLNGLVFASNNQVSSAWFEWGVNSSLGNKTQTFSVGSLPVVRHSEFIAGLNPRQTYYYRIVAENAYGKGFGAVSTFVAGTSIVAPVQVVRNVVAPRPRPATTVVNRVVQAPATVVTTGSASVQPLASLSMEGGVEMIGSGEKRTYRVSWKNESSQPLKNTVLRIIFPKLMNVESATKGSYSKEDNSILVDLGTIIGGESGDIFIFATASRGISPGEVLVVVADMVFTGTSGVQGDVIAYVMHRAETTKTTLAASVIGAGEFIPTTLFEWILLMILVLILVLLGNHLYGRFSKEVH